MIIRVSMWSCIYLCSDLSVVCVLYLQAGGSGHLRKETSTSDSRGGPGRRGELGFSRPQETPSECGPGRRKPRQSLLRPEQDACRRWCRWVKGDACVNTVIFTIKKKKKITRAQMLPWAWSCFLAPNLPQESPARRFSSTQTSVRRSCWTWSTNSTRTIVWTDCWSNCLSQVQRNSPEAALSSWLNINQTFHTFLSRL